MGNCISEVPQPRKRITHISFYNKGIRDTDFLKAIQSHHTHVVRQMDLAWNKLTFQSMGLISTASWNSLTFLNLNSNSISNKGCKYLSKARFPNVLRIILSDNKLDDSGVLHVSKTSWSTLRSICFGSNCIKEAGVRWLARSKWEGIQTISLRTIRSQEDNNSMEEKDALALVSLGKHDKLNKRNNHSKINNFEMKIDMSSFKCEVLSKRLNERWCPVLLINL